MEKPDQELFTAVSNKNEQKKVCRTIFGPMSTTSDSSSDDDASSSASDSRSSSVIVNISKSEAAVSVTNKDITTEEIQDLSMPMVADNTDSPEKGTQYFGQCVSPIQSKKYMEHSFLSPEEKVTFSKIAEDLDILNAHETYTDDDLKGARLYTGPYGRIKSPFKKFSSFQAFKKGVKRSPGKFAMPNVKRPRPSENNEDMMHSGDDISNDSNGSPCKNEIVSSFLSQITEVEVEKDEDSSEDDQLEIIESNTDLDQALEEKSSKLHLSAIKVKSIIHKIVTNEDVVEMVRKAVQESLEENEQKYEPTLTRYKLKQFEAQGQVPPYWGLMVKKPESPIFLNMELPDDEDDDEDFNPDIVHEESDEDSESNISFNTSDIGSPMPSTPNSQSSLFLSPAMKSQMIFTPENSSTCMSSPMGPPLQVSILRSQYSSSSLGHKFQEALEKDAWKETEEELIASRTRSKCPLIDRSIVDIEANLVAPDITQDMYDTVIDNDYRDFLVSFITPTDTNLAGGTSDLTNDEEDPDYNFLQEMEDEYDEEDFRNDRAVEVSKKEVNLLIDELFDDSMCQYDAIDESCRQNIMVQSEKILMNSHKQNQYQQTMVQAIGNHERRQIDDHMRKHIQLLSQAYVMLQDGIDEHKHAADVTKMYLTELQKFSVGAKSVYLTTTFDACNLQSALELLDVSTWISTSSDSHSSNGILFKYGNLILPTLTESQMTVMWSNPTFMFPELLPHGGFFKLCDIKKDQSRTKFLDSEDNLLAIGLDQFKHLSNAKDYIQQFLLPCRSKKQINIRIKNLSSKSAKDNPVKFWKTYKRLPAFTQCTPFYHPNMMRAPKDKDLDFNDLPNWCKFFSPSGQQLLSETVREQREREREKRRRRKAGLPGNSCFTPPDIMNIYSSHHLESSPITPSDQGIDSNQESFGSSGTSTMFLESNHTVRQKRRPTRKKLNMNTFDEKSLLQTFIPLSMSPSTRSLGRFSPLTVPSSEVSGSFIPLSGSPLTVITGSNSISQLGGSVVNQLGGNVVNQLGGNVVNQLGGNVVRITSSPVIVSGGPPTILVIKKEASLHGQTFSPASTYVVTSTVGQTFSLMHGNNSLSAPMSVPQVTVCDTLIVHSGVDKLYQPVKQTNIGTENIGPLENFNSSSFVTTENVPVLCSSKVQTNNVCDSHIPFAVDVLSCQSSNMSPIPMNSCQTDNMTKSIQYTSVLPDTNPTVLIPNTHSQQLSMDDWSGKEDVSKKLNGADKLSNVSSTNLEQDMTGRITPVLLSSPSFCEITPKTPLEMVACIAPYFFPPINNNSPYNHQQFLETTPKKKEGRYVALAPKQTCPSSSKIDLSQLRKVRSSPRREKLNAKARAILPKGFVFSNFDTSPAKKAASNLVEKAKKQSGYRSILPCPPKSEHENGTPQYASPPTLTKKVGKHRTSSSNNIETGNLDVKKNAMAAKANVFGNKDCDTRSNSEEISNIITTEDLKILNDNNNAENIDEDKYGDMDSEYTQSEDENETQVTEGEDENDTQITDGDDGLDTQGTDGETVDESQEEMEDDECQMRDLPASTIVRDAPSREEVCKRLGKKDRDRDNTLSLLAPDIIESDPQRDYRDTLFAQAYLHRVKKVLKDDLDTFEKFLHILFNFGKNEASPIKLYRDLQTLLCNYKDLMYDFAAFLKSEQAMECGCYQAYKEFHQARTFLRKIEIYFSKNPNQLQKVMRTFSRWYKKPGRKESDLREQIEPMLKGQKHLLEEFSMFFPNERPPESMMEDCEDIVFEDNDDNEVKNTSFEEIELLDMEDEVSGTKHCTCQCHVTGDDTYKKRKKHCYSCCLTVIDGELVYRVNKSTIKRINVTLGPPVKMSTLQSGNETSNQLPTEVNNESIQATVDNEPDDQKWFPDSEDSDEQENNEQHDNGRNQSLELSSKEGLIGGAPACNSQLIQQSSEAAPQQCSQTVAEEDLLRKVCDAVVDQGPDIAGVSHVDENISDVEFGNVGDDKTINRSVIEEKLIDNSGNIVNITTDDTGFTNLGLSTDTNIPNDILAAALNSAMISDFSMDSMNLPFGITVDSPMKINSSLTSEQSLTSSFTLQNLQTNPFQQSHFTDYWPVDSNLMTKRTVLYSAPSGQRNLNISADSSFANAHNALSKPIRLQIKMVPSKPPTPVTSQTSSIAVTSYSQEASVLRNMPHFGPSVIVPPVAISPPSETVSKSCTPIYTNSSLNISYAMKPANAAMISVPSAAMMLAPNATVVSAPNAAMMTTPNATVVSAPDVAMMTTPNAPLVSAPNAAMMTTPNATVASAPNAAMMTTPNATVVSAPNAAMMTTPNAPVVSAPSAAMMTTPNATVVSAPNAAMMTTPNVLNALSGRHENSDLNTVDSSAITEISFPVLRRENMYAEPTAKVSDNADTKLNTNEDNSKVMDKYIKPSIQASKYNVRSVGDNEVKSSATISRCDTFNLNSGLVGILSKPENILEASRSPPFSPFGLEIQGITLAQSPFSAVCSPGVSKAVVTSSTVRRITPIPIKDAQSSSHTTFQSVMESSPIFYDSLSNNSSADSAIVERTSPTETLGTVMSNVRSSLERSKSLLQQVLQEEKEKMNTQSLSIPLLDPESNSQLLCNFQSTPKCNKTDTCDSQIMKQTSKSLTIDQPAVFSEDANVGFPKEHIHTSHTNSYNLSDESLFHCLGKQNMLSDTMHTVSNLTNMLNVLDGKTSVNGTDCQKFCSVLEMGNISLNDTILKRFSVDKQDILQTENERETNVSIREQGDVALLDEVKVMECTSQLDVACSNEVKVMEYTNHPDASSSSSECSSPSDHVITKCDSERYFPTTVQSIENLERIRAGNFKVTRLSDSESSCKTTPSSSLTKFSVEHEVVLTGQSVDKSDEQAADVPSKYLVSKGQHLKGLKKSAPKMTRRELRKSLHDSVENTNKEYQSSKDSDFEEQKEVIHVMKKVKENVIIIKEPSVENCSLSSYRPTFITAFHSKQIPSVSEYVQDNDQAHSLKSEVLNYCNENTDERIHNCEQRKEFDVQPYNEARTGTSQASSNVINEGHICSAIVKVEGDDDIVAAHSVSQHNVRCVSDNVSNSKKKSKHSRKHKSDRDKDKNRMVIDGDKCEEKLHKHKKKKKKKSKKYKRETMDQNKDDAKDNDIMVTSVSLSEQDRCQPMPLNVGVFSDVAQSEGVSSTSVASASTSRLPVETFVPGEPTWSRDTDKIVLETCKKHGIKEKSFVRISKKIGGVTSKQVRQRFARLYELIFGQPYSFDVGED